jgi:hypothetical protein
VFYDSKKQKSWEISRLLNTLINFQSNIRKKRELVFTLVSGAPQILSPCAVAPKANSVLAVLP